MPRDLNYELLIEVRADLARAQKKIRGLERDVKRAGKAGDRAARETDRLGKSFKRASITAGLLRKTLIGFGALFAGVGVVARKWVQNTVRQEQAIAQLESRIRATGGAAGRTSIQLQEAAAALQDVTTYGDEATQEMQALLLSFRNIKGDQFDDATEAVLDLAIGLGTDLKSAAIQLGKSLNDPIIGLTAMNRSGITFSQTQQSLIKGFVATNNLAQAQDLILQEISQQFGGAARAARATRISQHPPFAYTCQRMRGAEQNLCGESMQQDITALLCYHTNTPGGLVVGLSSQVSGNPAARIFFPALLDCTIRR